MRAVIYTRVSTDGQREASHDDQARNCERIAERQGWNILRRYTDHGISGTKSDRPEYQAMLAAAKAREFDVLLIDELSRFSRDTVESERAIRALEFRGVRIVSVDGYDSTSRGKKLHRGMKALMNAEYVDVIRHETHRGLEGRARNGFSVGGRAYGYRSEPVIDEQGKVTGARLLIVEEHAAVVREIFELYAAGWSARRIANELNARRTPSPGAVWRRKTRRTDGKWLTSTIAGDPSRGVGILNNDLYRGVRVWNRSRRVENPETEKTIAVRRPADELVTFPVPELRIVPQPLWDRVKARQRQRSEQIGTYVRNGLAVANVRGNGRGPKYAFSGLLKCAVCGASFTVTGPTQSYVCASHTNGGKHACSNNLRVKRQIVEARLLEAIQRDLVSPANIKETLDVFQQRARRVLRERRAARSANRGADDARLKKLTKERDNLIEAIATMGLKGNAGIAERLARTEAELRDLEARAGADAAELGAVVDMLPRAAERLQKLVSDLGDVLRRDVARGQAALRGLLGESIRLAPAETGDHLVAEVGFATGVFAKSLNIKENIRLVAGAGFEPATFGL